MVENSRSKTTVDSDDATFENLVRQYAQYVRQLTRQELQRTQHLESSAAESFDQNFSSQSSENDINGSAQTTNLVDTSQVRQQIEQVTLQMITLCSRLKISDDRVLRTISIMDTCQTGLFELLTPQYGHVLEYLKAKHSHLTAEDIVPVFCQDIQLYELSIDTYVSNGYYEQAYELFENLKKQATIEHKTQVLMDKMKNHKEEEEEESPITSTQDAQGAQEEQKATTVDKQEQHFTTNQSGETTVDSTIGDDGKLMAELAVLDAISAAEEEKMLQEQITDPLDSLFATATPNGQTGGIDDELLQIPLFTLRKTYESLIVAFSAIGKLKHIVSLMQFMTVHSETHESLALMMDRSFFETVLKSFASNSHIAGVLHYLDEMTNRRHIEPTFETTTIVINSFIQSNDERYRGVFNAMVLDKLRTEDNNDIGEDNGDDLPLLKQVPWTKSLFETYISGLCSVSHDLETSFQLLKHYMNQYGGSSSSSQDQEKQEQLVDIHLCNKLLLACVNAHDTMRGMEVYELILDPSNELSPNVDTFNLVLRLFSVVGDRRALALFSKFRTDAEQARKDASLLSHESRSPFISFVPNVETYNALIEMHVVQNDLKGANKILKLMKANGVNPNVISHNLIIKLHYASWQPKLARNKKKSIFDQYLQRSQEKAAAAAAAASAGQHDEPSMFDFLESAEEDKILEGLISGTDMIEDADFQF